MNGLKKLPIVFSAAALIVSVLVCIIKGVSPATALQRAAASVVLFYILGYFTCTFLLKDADESETNDKEADLQQEDGEEFEEIEFPVIEHGEKDMPVRG